MGGGIGMGNTCKPMAVSFQCMTKFTTNKFKKKSKKKKRDVGSMLGPVGSPAVGHGNRLQCSCLNTPVNRGA